MYIYYAHIYMYVYINMYIFTHIVVRASKVFAASNLRDEGLACGAVISSEGRRGSSARSHWAGLILTAHTEDC